MYEKCVKCGLRAPLQCNDSGAVPSEINLRAELESMNCTDSDGHEWFLRSKWIDEYYPNNESY